LWKRFRSAGQVIWVAAASSASIEISQYLAQFISSYRTSDVDDVILNTVGAFLGMLAVRAFVHLRNAKAGSAIWQE
jgi:glycopeptide antibiotics resistance protein